jgi:hypothetical protein
MTESKSFLEIEALNDAEGKFGTGPDYYINDYCRFTFIGRDIFSGKLYTIPNCKYINYNESTDEYQFTSSMGYIMIRRQSSGKIELTIQFLILNVDNILLTEKNDTRHEIRHITAGKRRKRKRRTKKRTKKRRYL